MHNFYLSQKVMEVMKEGEFRLGRIEGVKKGYPGMAVGNMIEHQQRAQKGFHAAVNIFVELETTFK